jgi:hypothetical protein
MRPLEGAEMIREQQVIEEIGVLSEDPTYRTAAYRYGWEAGRFGPLETFLENSNLARWESHQERLAYYRGHRDGRWDRERLAQKVSPSPGPTP